MKTLGQKMLDEYLSTKGIEKKVAAKQLNISADRLSKIIRGVVKPSVADVIKFEDWSGGKIEVRTWTIPQNRVLAEQGN